MTAKRPIPRVGVLVRFEPSEIAAIDAARGPITRQDWIAGAALGVSRHATKPEKAAKLESLKADIKVRRPDIKVGAFRSRLKGEWKAP